MSSTDARNSVAGAPRPRALSADLTLVTVCGLAVRVLTLATFDVGSLARMDHAQLVSLTTCCLLITLAEVRPVIGSQTIDPVGVGLSTTFVVPTLLHFGLVPALFSRADVAMYLAKDDRTGVEVYSAARDASSAPRIGMLSGLRQAIELGEGCWSRWTSAPAGPRCGCCASLPAAEIKIDRSFVSPVASVAEDRVVVGGLTAMAHRLGMQVVAEGIETSVIRSIVAELGCDAAQGWHLSARCLRPRRPAGWPSGWDDLAGPRRCPGGRRSQCPPPTVRSRATPRLGACPPSVATTSRTCPAWPGSRPPTSSWTASAASWR